MVSDHDIVTACLTLEESRTDGMAAIMCVVNNRAKGDPKKFKETVLKKWQFSCMNPHTVEGKSLADIEKKAKKRAKFKERIARKKKRAAAEKQRKEEEAKKMEEIKKDAKWGLSGKPGCYSLKWQENLGAPP